jgi:sporulation protein YlmC with PRC-barrel domain
MPQLMVGFDLLDRQIVDSDGIPVGKVDDVEFTVDGEGRVRVEALLTGQRALGARFGGTLGRWITAVAARLDIDRRGPRRIPYRLVADVDSAVHLRVRRELLAEPPLEAWLNEHLIGRIPGADDDQ